MTEIGVTGLADRRGSGCL